MHHPTYRIAHTTAFVTAVVEHWLERDIAQLVHPTKDRSDDPSLLDKICSIPCFFGIKSVCRNVESKGKVFWK